MLLIVGCEHSQFVLLPLWYNSIKKIIVQTASIMLGTHSYAHKICVLMMPRLWLSWFMQ